MDYLDHGRGICNGHLLAMAPPVLTVPGIIGLPPLLPSEVPEPDNIRIALGDRVMSHQPVSGFVPGRADPRHLLRDMFDAAQSEIILMSTQLNVDVYKDATLLDDLRAAAEEGVAVWMIVRGGRDWAWWDEHPVGKVLSEREGLNVFVRTLGHEAEAALGTRGRSDFAIVDRKYFRYEDDGSEIHAKAALSKDVSAFLRSHFSDLWLNWSDNLTGAVQPRLVLDERIAPDGSGVFLSPEFHGIYVEYAAGDRTAATARLEASAAIIMGANYARMGMKYRATLLDKGAHLEVVSNGIPASAPEGEVRAVS